MTKEFDAFLEGFGVVKAEPTAVETFLAHHGVKGQKWGVRRSVKELGGGFLARRAEAKTQAQNDKLMLKMKPGASVTIQNATTGEFKTLVKGSTGTWHETSLTENPGHVFQAQAKPGHQLDNDQLREAITRQRMIEDYTRLFNPPQTQQKSEIERRIDQMTLQKKYQDLQRDLTPAKKDNAKAFVKTVKGGFTAFKAVDKVLGGNLSKGVNAKLGLLPPKSEIEKLKESTDLFKAQTKNIESKSELYKIKHLNDTIFDDDAVSKAFGYSGAGKRKKGGGKSHRA